MSSSNCCFLACIQISHEAGQVVWYSHLSQNFPQFIVIHTVKGFGIVNKAEIDVFLELSCFFHDPADVGNLIPGSSAFSKTSLNIRKWGQKWLFSFCLYLPLNQIILIHRDILNILLPSKVISIDLLWMILRNLTTLTLQSRKMFWTWIATGIYLSQMQILCLTEFFTFNNPIY